MTTTRQPGAPQVSVLQARLTIAFPADPAYAQREAQGEGGKRLSERGDCIQGTLESSKQQAEWTSQASEGQNRRV